MHATAPHDVNYGDVALMLGEWLGGSVLPAIDAACAELGSDHWTSGTRERVMLAVGHALTERFGSGRSMTESEESLQRESIDGIAQYVVARSILLTTQARS